MLENAIAVLHRYFPRWNLGISAQTLFLQDETGAHILSATRLKHLPLIRQLMQFIQRIKARFAPRKVLLTWRDAFKRDIAHGQSQARYSIIDRRVGHDGTIWLGLAYGPADKGGILWRKA